MNFTPRLRRLTLAALIVAGLFSLGWFAWIISPSARGTLMAKRDINRGVRELKAYGMISMNSVYSQRIMNDQYHVQIRFVAGCIVRERDAKYWNAYNKTMEARIIQEHGPEVFKACDQEVVRQLQRDGYLQ